MLSLPKVLSLSPPPPHPSVPRQVSASFEAATYYLCCVSNHIKIWTGCAHVKLSVVHVVLQRSTETSFTGPRQGTCQKKSGEKPVRAKNPPFYYLHKRPGTDRQTRKQSPVFFLFFLFSCFIGPSAKATERDRTEARRPYRSIRADWRGLFRVMRAKCPPPVTTMKGHCS